MATSLKVLVPYYFASCILLLMFGIFKLIYLLPCTGKCVQKLVKFSSTIEMQKEDYWKSLFGMKMFKNYQKIILRQLEKEAYAGRKTPNPLLFSADGSTTHRLLDRAQGERPMVVNFGSCTCPVFMARLQEFGEIVERFGDVADFVTVYIEEAHPTDEWSFKNSRLEIPQPTSQEDRCMAADALISSGVLKTHLLVDSIDNNASKAFAAMPIRLYIIQNEIVQYAGGVGPTFYKPSEVAKWLENYILTDPNNNTLCKVEVV